MMEQVTVPEEAAPADQWSMLQLGLTAGDLQSEQRKILIVGGHEQRRASDTLLAGLKCERLEADNTSEAVAQISLHRVDLVLIELTAPDVGAIEFCQTIKKASATQFLPVFVTSRAEDPESEVRAIEAGADEFFTMPVRETVFQAHVKASLRRKAIVDSLDDSETVLFSLARSVEGRDPGLGEHCQRLSLMASAMGAALALSAHKILALQRGGYLHDIGKVAIPDNILFKAGPLTPAEWEVMKSHADRGEQICRNMRSLAPVLPIIRHHHEKWDGSGYPDGLKGEEIPLSARILQLADIYDALTTVRSYKAALSPGQALQVIRQEVQKGWRDGRLVELFADLLPMFTSAAPPDWSRLSLTALANSIEGFRTDPGKNESKTSLLACQARLSR